MTQTVERTSKEVLNDLDKSVRDFVEKTVSKVNAHNEKINEIQQQADRLEEILNRPSLGLPVNAGKKAKRFAVTPTGQKLPILAKDEQFAAHHPASNQAEQWSIGDFVRQSMGLQTRSNAIVERGTATIETTLAAKIIDDVRKRNTLIQAGSSTIVIDGKTVISKITGDAVIHTHSEGVADISPSLPTFAGVELDPAMLVCQIPLSVEIVADSTNLDQLLRVSLAGAFSRKLDDLGLTTLLGDANISESAAGQDPGLWSGITGAVGSHLANDGDLPQALITSSSEFNARNSQTVTGGEWLGRPDYLSNMSDLHSTAMTSGKGLLGDFANGVLLAMRQDLRIEVVRWNGLTDASHMLVAYLRGGFYVAQHKSLFRILKTV
ncbi:MAG: phage major capsid protein [Burkholderiales bacterium]|nr:phage major capsid protein [Burkholderiales bacterium]MCP5251558.1 phage major capsid protein [Burkholderiales bacterium]